MLISILNVKIINNAGNVNQTFILNLFVKNIVHLSTHT